MTTDKQKSHEDMMGDFNTIAMSQPGDVLIATATFNVEDTQTGEDIIMSKGDCVTLLAPPDGSQYTTMPYLYGMATIDDDLIHVAIGANKFRGFMVVSRAQQPPTFFGKYPERPMSRAEQVEGTTT
jgi:hypothetical protein